MAGDLIRWKPCYAFTACSIGTTWAMARWKMLCTKSPPCVCLPGYPWIAPCRTAPPSWISATCWSSINWPANCSRPSIAGWPKQASWWLKAPLVDATIIEAPSSTKNKEQQRDPQMHQTKKGNQWHFGMKAHIGVDAKSGLTHSLVTTAANEHDLNQLGNLLHGEEQFVSADAGYQRGATARGAGRGGCWLADRRAPGKVRTLKQHPRKNKTAINIEYMKASIRAKVEHRFASSSDSSASGKPDTRGCWKTITNWRCYSRWP